MDLQSDVSGATPRPRANRPGFTERFAGTWPEVDGPLRRYLFSLRVTPADVDDLVQEVARRALEQRVAFDDASELRRWCFVVARRLRVDDMRRNHRLRPLAGLPDVADVRASSELGRVEDQILLRAVEQAMSTLSPADQHALTAAQASTAPERNRLGVARHRARKRLAGIVGPLAGVSALGGLVARLRRPAALGAPARVASVALPAMVAIIGTQITTPWASHPTVHVGTGSSRLGRIAVVTPVAHSIPAHVRHVPAPVAVQPRPTKADNVEQLPTVSTTAPAGTWAKAGLRPNNGPPQRLVCIDGAIVGRVCTPFLSGRPSTTPRSR